MSTQYYRYNQSGNYDSVPGEASGGFVMSGGSVYVHRPVRSLPITGEPGVLYSVVGLERGAHETQVVQSSAQSRGPRQDLRGFVPTAEDVRQSRPREVPVLQSGPRVSQEVVSVPSGALVHDSVSQASEGQSETVSVEIPMPGSQEAKIYSDLLAVGMNMKGRGEMITTPRGAWEVWNDHGIWTLSGGRLHPSLGVSQESEQLVMREIMALVNYMFLAALERLGVDVSNSSGSDAPNSSGPDVDAAMDADKALESDVAMNPERDATDDPPVKARKSVTRKASTKKASTKKASTKKTRARKKI